ncbi:MAG: hypothetical protein RL071_190 [Pseudomonadota bacterium]
MSSPTSPWAPWWLAAALLLACAPPPAPQGPPSGAPPTRVQSTSTRPSLPALPALPSAVEAGAAPAAVRLPAPWVREDCAQAGDEDLDRRADCADDECWGPACAEDCATGGDEDDDGLADCEDADCAGGCLEDCSDRVDNNRNGRIDCDDEECALTMRCWTSLTLRPQGGATIAASSVRTDAHSLGQFSRSEHVSARLDGLEVHGLVASTFGGLRPCGALLSGLRLTQGTLYVDGASLGSQWLQFDSFQTASAATPIDGPCPAPTTLDVEALDLHFPWPAASSHSAGISVDELPDLRIEHGVGLIELTGLQMGERRSSVHRTRLHPFSWSTTSAAWSGVATGMVYIP